MRRTIYNFNFMGCMRETNNFSGHLTLDVLPDSFAFLGAKDYGGFTYVGGDVSIPVDDSLIRQVHDALIDIEGEGVPIEGITYYPRYKDRQSANIFHGDAVVDTRTGEVFTVQGFHDLALINRNQFYHLRDRPHKPKPVSREFFIHSLQTVDPLERWKPTNEEPKPSKIHKMFSLNGYTFYSHVDRDIYYVKGNNINLQIKSNISAPLWDTVDLLSGEVFTSYIDGSRVKYLLEAVETDQEYYRQEVFEEPVSFHYNNRLIQLGLTDKI